MEISKHHNDLINLNSTSLQDLAISAKTETTEQSTSPSDHPLGTESGLHKWK
jgi:hypothetical protein